MRALVLAAGMGTRLRPLTGALPKPLAPVLGRPVVEHLLRHAAHCGVDEAVVNLHYRGDQIQDYFGDGASVAIKMSYAPERELLGTAGAVRDHMGSLGRGRDFLVLSGDGLHRIPLDRLVDRHRATGAAATITVRPIPHPERGALVELDESGLVRRFVEKPPPEEVFTNLASVGVYCFSADVPGLMPGGPLDIAQDLIPLLLELGLPVAAFHAECFWSDVGTLDELAAANLAAAAGEVELPLADAPTILDGETPAVLPAPGSRVAAGASITGPAVVGPFAELGEDAHVSAAVVLPGARVLERTVVTGGLYGDPAAVAGVWRRLNSADGRA